MTNNHLDKIPRLDIIAKGMPNFHGNDLYVGHLVVPRDSHRHFYEGRDNVSFFDVHQGKEHCAFQDDEGIYHVFEKR